MNHALFEDVREKLTPWISTMMFALQHTRTDPVKNDMETWRGSHITKSQFDALRMYAVYRDPKFVSTSTSREVAEKFRDPYLHK